MRRVALGLGREHPRLDQGGGGTVISARMELAVAAPQRGSRPLGAGIELG
jgi:hypothetical protein